MRKLENILLPRFEGDQRVATLIHYFKKFLTTIFWVACNTKKLEQIFDIFLARAAWSSYLIPVFITFSGAQNASRTFGTSKES